MRLGYGGDRLALAPGLDTSAIDSLRTQTSVRTATGAARVGTGLRGLRSEVAQSNEIAAKLGGLNEDRRGCSLVGLQLVLLGFCVQLLESAVSFISGYFCSFS